MKKFLLIYNTLFAIFFFTSNAALSQPYFAKDLIPPTLLASPYQPGTPEWEKDLEEIVQLQKNPDQKEVEKALSEHESTTETIVQTIYPSADIKQNPQLFRLLDRTIETASLSVRNSKEFWQKKRPYSATKKVKLLSSESKSKNSYPSGHSTRAYVTAYVLGLLFPHQREDFMKNAHMVARHRVLLGMHWTNDVEAAQELALLVIGGLLSNEEFQRDLKEIKQTLKP